MLPAFKPYESYGNQNSTVLAQKQTPRPLGQSCEPRNKPTHTGAINLQQSSQEQTVGQDNFFS